MGSEINFWAVIVAAVGAMVVGAVWYAPSVFGKSWQKLTGLDNKKAQANASTVILAAAVISLITAYVLAHVAYLSNYFFQNSFLQDSLAAAFWVWLGFVAARFLTHAAFEQRPAKLSMINISYELVTLLTMGLIIGLIGT